MIQSDNCLNWYKSATHFHDVQNLLNEFNTKIIKIFDITQHGKGEVDHIAGIAKAATQREIVTGDFFLDACEMVEFLNSKYSSNQNPSYKIKKIIKKKLKTIRKGPS